MVKLSVALVLALAAAAAFAIVPVRGRTLLERWTRASGVADFLERGWHEARSAALASAGIQAPADPPRPARPARAAARPGGAAKGPVERHTEEDRAALERLVSEHAR